MIQAIIDIALRNRLFVLLVTGLVSLVGALVYQRMPKDIYPDLNAPLVNIITSCPGMAAEDVERMITFPLESLMNGTPGVIRVRSESTTGESVVTVEFDWGVDIYLARQIVSGKLGSAVVQVAIYTSAIAPCLAFTYMLRGISMPTILFVVVYAVLGALGLSVIGLLVGTLTGEKHWQVLLSVVLIVGLLIVFFIGIGITSNLVFDGDYMFGDDEFWMVMGMLLTAYLTYFALVFYAAVAQITFVSDNRSTRLRVIMLIQHACLIAWFGYIYFTVEVMDEEILYGLVSCMAFHWAVMGALMIGEWPELSMRVKRGLPQSFLGRAVLTWFNPGPGTGYMFACCGLIAACVTTCVMLLIGMASGLGGSTSSTDMEKIFAFSVLAPAYVIAYMGISLIFVRFLRRFTQGTLFVAALIQVLLITAGTAGPFVVESIVDSGGFGGYSLLQITNPFWSSAHIAEGGTMPLEAPVLLTVVPLTALIVFVLNLPGILHEVRHVRIAKPVRVAEEDEQLAAETKPHEPVQISPWDVQ